MSNAAAVTVGPGRLYAAAVGTTMPTSASAALASGFRQIGYTEAGSRIRSRMRNEPISVAEELDPVKYKNVSREMSVTFQVAEFDVRNLALAFNDVAGTAAAVPAGGTFEPPDPAAEVRVIIALDSNPDTLSANARWLFRQCYQAGDLDIAFQEAPNKSLIGVEFRLEKPTGAQAFKAFGDSNGYLNLG